MKIGKLNVTHVEDSPNFGEHFIIDVTNDSGIFFDLNGDPKDARKHRIKLRLTKETAKQLADFIDEKVFKEILEAKSANV